MKTVSDAPAAVLPKTVRAPTLLLFLTTLLVVSLVNMARMMRVEEYAQPPTRDAAPTNHIALRTLAPPATTTVPQSEPRPATAASIPPQTTASTTTPVEPPSTATFKPAPGCIKLHKSHVDPNFYHEDACYTRTQILTIIKELVFSITDAFDAHNVTYFLDSGTLLGAFRSQGVIPHENDADVGIDTAALEYIRRNPIAFPPQYAFTVWNSSLYPTSDRDDKLPARLIHKASGIYVDVFAFLDWKDPKTGAAKVGPLPSWCFFNCANCPTIKDVGKELKVDYDWIYPLVNCTFEGRTTLRCPHKTEAYLEYTFGSSYMTPVEYTFRRPTRARPPVLVLLLGALLLVTLINTARELEYFRLRDDVPAPSQDVVGTETNCTRLVASHVDPSFFHEDACLMRTEILLIIKELVFTIADAFDEHRVTYFLEAGTLLGAFRNHGVIVHDVDADVGIDTAGLDYIQHNPIEFPSEYAFTVWNSSLYPTSDRDDKLPGRLIHKASGLYVDVFAFLDWKDLKTGAAKVGPLPSWCFHNCVRCPTVKGGKELLVDPKWLFPVVNGTFEGRTTLKCPRESELYLRYTFGSDFMTPIAYNYNTASKLKATVWTLWPLVLLLLVGL